MQHFIFHNFPWNHGMSDLASALDAETVVFLLLW